MYGCIKSSLVRIVQIKTHLKGEAPVCCAPIHDNTDGIQKTKRFSEVASAPKSLMAFLKV